MAAPEYWIELSMFFVERPDTEALLKDCGLTVVRKGPITYRLGGEPDTQYWLVADPDAPAELDGKTVDLTFMRKATTPDTGDGPTMDVIIYKTEIIERKAI